MMIEIAVPEDWTPGQALAMRKLLQRAVSTGQPIVAAVRKDATAQQLEEIYRRVDALIREAGLQAT